MNIPDEAVQAAHAEYHKVLGDSNRSNPMLAALTAALPFLQGVKELEWVAHKGDQYCKIAWTCEGIGGWYAIEHRHEGHFDMWTPNNPDGGRFITLEAAKAAAQADYAARILSAIEFSVCKTCNGRGLVGGLIPWGDGEVDSVCEPCPDCAPSPRAQALEEAAILEALEECETYFDDRSDADHDETGFVPNEEMRILVSVRAAIRALSQPVADGWLPIETAPKDGTQILIEVHPGIFDVVCWSDNAWREGGNFMRLRKEPTRYLPLPASPGASE